MNATDRIISRHEALGWAIERAVDAERDDVEQLLRDIRSAVPERVLMAATDPTWGEAVGERKVRVHSPELCKGEFCVIHNPSEHHMRDWPAVIRLDKLSLVERTCPHGVGHPDPDSRAFFVRIHKPEVGVHGCDGCCSPP